jgi:hypothetical protein
VAHSGLGATHEARDQWSRTYPLEAGGDVQIVNGVGNVEVRTGSGADVTVTADRIAKAASEQTARDVVPRIQIREDVTPAKIVLTTEGLSGLVIGVSARVDYHVTVPAGAAVRIRTVDGVVKGSDIAGRFVATTTNGTITGTNMRGGIDARSVNGNVTLDVAAVGTDPIDLRVTNGAAELALPADAKANLSATVTNGKIDTGGLAFEALGEQTPRRVRGRLNGGGAPVEVNAINGGIRIRPRQ